MQIYPGNGPSGLALSAVLDGWRPYFDTQQRHADAQIDQQLRENANLFEQVSCSLLHRPYSYTFSTSASPTFFAYLRLQDLVTLAGGGTAVGRFIDSLIRPDADGLGDAGSLVRWYRDADVVEHLVVSTDEPAGSWNHFPALVLVSMASVMLISFAWILQLCTASVGSWFDLPAYTYVDYRRSLGDSAEAAEHAGKVRRTSCNNSALTIQPLRRNALQLTTCDDTSPFMPMHCN